MNYSRKNKNQFALAFMSLVIGFLLCLIATNCRQKEEQLEVVTPVYGTYDNRIFTEEISFDWSSGAELGFVPMDIDLDEELQEFIYCLAYGYNIDFAFVMGLIQAESGFDPNVISATNDYGLMQINQVNHGWIEEQLGITDFLDPYQNVRAGMFILRKLFEKYEDPNKVLMAYNLGESGAAQLWQNGVYTTVYIDKINHNIANFTNFNMERVIIHD